MEAADRLNGSNEMSGDGGVAAEQPDAARTLQR